MSVFHENMLIGSSGQGGAAPPAGYQVERSLRFNSSAYLSRTPASSGNRRTWTWAGWVKRSKGGARQGLFGSVPSGSNFTVLEFDANDRLNVYDSTVSGFISRTTSAVHRDYSAWMHVVWVYDTTAATAANRVKLYVNGTEITAFSTSVDPALNTDTQINLNQQHVIGSQLPTSGLYLDGYLAEIHFIDGQALTPTSFAETNATTGQWVPKAYSGTYGTNGYKLTFSDNSGTTSTTLGKDTSGNNNNWTPSGFSVTAGTGNDSLVDTPTSYGTGSSGGDVRGNFATLNPLAKGSNVTLTNGNLDYACTLTSNTLAVSTIAMSSGKWYCEFTATSSNNIFGLYKASLTSDIAYVGVDANGWGYYSLNGNKYNNGSGTTYGSTFTTNDVIGVAFDADAGSLYFYKNGVAQNSGTAAFTGLTSGPYVFATGTNNGSISAVFNAGQRAFAYTAPSGFKALCDTNLTAPTIAKPNTVMDVKLYTGNGSTQTISGLGFSPDLVWIKDRINGSYNHLLFDQVRGVNKYLAPSSTIAEGGLTGEYLTSFNSDGFALASQAGVNVSPNAHVAWTWDAGSSNATNTSGTITSTVRANTSAGFSIVTYTGNGTAGATVGHSLGVAPELLIIKPRSTTGDWIVYSKVLGNNKSLFLDLTLASTTTTNFNNTTPSSTVFTVSSSGEVNGNGTTYVAYCWTPVAGLSSFGSYIGNGSSNGPFVYTGFRPAVVLVKMSSSTGNWTILDDKREGYNVDNDPLYPNLGSAEGTTDLIDITSNGFKVRTTDATFNTNAGTYIYAAWASAPFPYARAR